ncbi:MAG: LPS-assembly lipoprotein [Hyphomicrobiales bacterium]|jgi:LPS-assembly lipoprotein|nr:LPS-assembly lipoprotein [Hyphomicrobiales bacterium]
MWWRNPIRSGAVIALGALNAACFQPLYASRSVAGGTPLGTQLAQVQVERVDAPNGAPESRVATELQNALDFEMSGGGGLISPTHRLKVRMTVGRSSIISDITTGRVMAEITGIDTTFTLTELATGKAVMSGRTFARVSSDYPGQQQRFARVRARLDAENRAAKVIAENVRTRVASFFVAGT